LQGQHFDMVVCAAAPGQKWLANREPDADRRRIEQLMRSLQSFRCDTFVLISTVDVFRQPLGVTEESAVELQGLQPYGLHRYELEQFARSQFARCHVVRLPGLVGPGLRKNVIYDLHHRNNLDAIDSRGIFQFYPTVNLWFDIQHAVRHQLALVHLCAEPIQVSEVAELGFGIALDQPRDGPAPRYDMQSRHAALFGASGPYQTSRRETLQAIRAYAQTEPVLQSRPGAAG